MTVLKAITIHTEDQDIRLEFDGSNLASMVVLPSLLALAGQGTAPAAVTTPAVTPAPEPPVVVTPATPTPVTPPPVVVAPTPTPVPAPVPAFKKVFGINLMDNRDFNTQKMEADLLRQARYVSSTWNVWDDGRAIDFVSDSTGFELRSVLPGQLVRMILSTSPPPVANVTIRYQGATPSVMGGVVIKSEPGLLEVAPEANQNFCLSLSAPCKILSVIHPSSGLQRLQQLPKLSGIRFMDPLRINTIIGKSEDLLSSTEIDSVISGQGVTANLNGMSPYSYKRCFEIAGDRTPWLCIHANATNGQMARAVKEIARLANGRQVFVELSNEVWNSLFQQSAQWSNIWDVNMGAYLERCAELAKICELYPNLLSVVGAQAGNPWWVEQSVVRIKRLVADTPTTLALPRVLSVAPYFGEGLPADPIVFTDGRLQQEVDKAVEQAKEATAIAHTHGMLSVAYECGPHVRDERSDTNAGVLNRDPRMQAVLKDYLTRVAAVQDGLFYYSFIDAPGTHGAWGLLENTLQATSPKWEAFKNFLEEVA